MTTPDKKRVSVVVVASGASTVADEERFGRKIAEKLPWVHAWGDKTLQVVGTGEGTVVIFSPTSSVRAANEALTAWKSFLMDEGCDMAPDATAVKSQLTKPPVTQQDVLACLAGRKSVNVKTLCIELCCDEQDLRRVLTALNEAGYVRGEQQEAIRLTQQGVTAAETESIGGRRGVIRVLLRNGNQPMTVKRITQALGARSTTVAKRSLKLLIDEGMVQYSQKKGGENTYLLTEEGLATGEQYEPKKQNEWGQLGHMRAQIVAHLLESPVGNYVTVRSVLEALCYSCTRERHVRQTLTDATRHDLVRTRNIAEGHRTTFGYTLTEKGLREAQAYLALYERRCITQSTQVCAIYVQGGPEVMAQLMALVAQAEEIPGVMVTRV